MFSVSFDQIRALLFGQLISILIAGTGIFATFLSERGVNFPTLLNLLNYGLLSTYLLRRFLRLRNTTTKQANDPSPKRNLWWYFGAAILDVEANYLVILAYNYTSITSIMLLDCFTIPCTMLLSYIFLGYRYSFRHCLGVCICLIGLVCIVLSDTLINGAQPNSLKGDILCLAGSALYASSNVLQETMVKFYDREEFLGKLGGFGVFITFIQFLATDLSATQHAHFDGLSVFFLLGFVFCLFFIYVNVSYLLQFSDATLFNLSLLTSDVYAVIFAYFATGSLVHWLYFIAFGLVCVGLVTYHSSAQLNQYIQPTEEESMISSASSHTQHHDNTKDHINNDYDSEIGKEGKGGIGGKGDCILEGSTRDLEERVYSNQQDRREDSSVGNLLSYEEQSNPHPLHLLLPLLLSHP